MHDLPQLLPLPPVPAAASLPPILTQRRRRLPARRRHVFASAITPPVRSGAIPRPPRRPASSSHTSPSRPLRHRRLRHAASRVNGATAYPAIADLMGSDNSIWVSSLDVTTALSTSAQASSMDSTVEAGVKAHFNMLGSTASMIGIQFCIQHPFSRGYIHINSTSVFDYPEINPNYLPISYELDAMRAALQYVRRIIATSPMSGMISSPHTMATEYGVAERAADLIKATYGGGANTSTSGSTPDSSLPPLSSSSSNPDTAATTSELSTGAKVAIAAGSAVAIAALMELRRRANRNRGVNSRATLTNQTSLFFPDAMSAPSAQGPDIEAPTPSAPDILLPLDAR
ncbi:hypothetical protein GGX14DRAFT_602546 [Mycena pura]|uniref:Glucose-methanol-choline oxidoreductase C-terminal domain-containing protein n=1 Tax=Mycena pura TaxID=153505 RepID=A0AAD6YEN2_9AGAR|nr:hypothetical protein GGX14DRAFT_602546 [Mycena pura]